MTPSAPTPVFLGLGSNIDPEQNLRAAAGLLRKRWPAIRFSPVCRSAAREVESQDDFLNAVAMMETDDSPEQVAAYLHEVETSLKKSLPYRFGPRTIDLDLLLYGDRVIETSELTVPHPRMHERRFVLEPLCAVINPVSLHPMLTVPWKEFLEKTKDQNCQKTALEL